MSIVRVWRRPLSGIIVAVGMAVAAGMPGLAAAQDIVVGQIGPFTKLPSPDAHEINQGVKAYFAQVNAKGGINGRRLSLFELDDQYNGDEFVKQFDVAMQRKPIALLSPIGSAAVKRLLDDKLLDRNNVIVLNAIPGAEALRTPGHPDLFHVRAGDRQQIEKIVRHARALGIARMHVVYQNLPIGSSGLAVAKEAGTGGDGGKLAVEGVEAKHDEAALADAAKHVAASGTQSVLVIGSPKYMADAINQLRKAGVSQVIFALSYLPADLVIKVAGINAARGVGIAQTYPNPMGATMPLHREFAATMKAFDPQLSAYTAFHLEGYLCARVLVEGLRRAPRDATPPQLAKALRSLGEVDMGGFRVNFSGGNAGSKFVDIGVVAVSGRLIY